MSDVKAEIKFQRSMTADKRDQAFAYLRKNLFPSRSGGLYPSVDFVQERPDNLTSSENILDVLGSEDGTFDIKVIVESGTDVKFYNLGSNTTSNTTLTAKDYECGAFGNDGVYAVMDDDHVYKVQHVNSNTSDAGTFLEARPHLGGFDGLYYWWLSNNEIYKQLGGDAPTVAFNNIGLTPRFFDFWNDQMVIFCEDASGIVVLFWDKSDLDLFDKRIFIPNAKLIAAGINNGTLQVVKSVGNSSNSKERDGEIVVTAYDGEKFVRQNSIKAGDRTVEYVKNTGVGIGSEVILFSVDGNFDTHNEELYQNYIYKIQSDGAIEVQWLDDAVSGDVDIVRVFYNFILYATSGLGAVAPRIFINEDNDDSYNGYSEFNNSTYITNFLNNPYNLHKLDGFAVAFEKLFEQTTEDPTGEELDIYYRVSERDDFTLLGNVTVEKVKDYVNARGDQSTEYASDVLGLPEQRYMISKMPDDSALPEFNEIQFKFVSKRGFSIIGAWYLYSYLSRNTFN